MINKNKNYIINTLVLKEILVVFNVDKAFFEKIEGDKISVDKLQKLFTENIIDITFSEIIKFAKDKNTQVKVTELVTCMQEKEMKKEKKLRFKELERKISSPKILNNSSEFVDNKEGKVEFVKKEFKVDKNIKKKNKNKKGKVEDIFEFSELDTARDKERKIIVKNRIEAVKQKYENRKNKIDTSNMKREKEIFDKIEKRFMVLDNLSYDLKLFLDKECVKENKIRKDVNKLLSELKKKVAKDFKNNNDMSLLEKEKYYSQFKEKINGVHVYLSKMVGNNSDLDKKYQELMLKVNNDKKFIPKSDRVKIEFPKFTRTELVINSEPIEFASCKKSLDEIVYKKNYILNENRKNVVKTTVILEGQATKLKKIRKYKKDLYQVKKEKNKKNNLIFFKSRREKKYKLNEIVNKYRAESEVIIDSINKTCEEELIVIQSRPISKDEKNRLIQISIQNKNLKIHKEKQNCKTLIDKYKVSLI